MISAEVIGFLKGFPPFKFLSDEDLGSLVGGLSMEFFPQGTIILKQGGKPSPALFIVKKGGVRISMMDEKGREQTVDYRGEGDTFGFLSLIGKETQNTTVVAEEDTICYMAGKESVLRLMERDTAFMEYFLKSHFSKYIHRTYSEMHTRSFLYGASEKALFTTPISQLVTREVVTATPETTIAEAARIMSKHGISSIVVASEGRVPVGIVTDRDLREKVLARGKNPSDSLKDIMSTMLIKADARDLCFEGILKMISYNVHHLLVVEAGALIGIVTNHDLMMLQGISPLALVKEVEDQWSIEGLANVSGKIMALISILLKEGAKAENIARILTEINDRIERKVLVIAERTLGQPPVPYCWIVYGSEGRREQTFRTDQDNAIIYRDPSGDTEAESASRYFKRFSEFVIDALIRCGFTRCPGNYMASNEAWRRPLSVWKEYFTKWISTPTPEAILFSVILFDFRALHGEKQLAEELRTHLNQAIKGQDLFLKYMADMVTGVRPPLGFFKNFIVEKSGEHKNEMNLKFKCIAPVVNIARLLALASGVSETGTQERLAGVGSVNPALREYVEELEHAFEFIMLLRIHHQYSQIEAGAEPDNFIDPEKLSNMEKRTLKETCQLISRVLDYIERQYKPGTRL